MSEKNKNGRSSGELRSVTTPQGQVVFLLQRKQIKNINLRLGGDGVLRLSVPRYVSDRQAEAFLINHSDWIAEHLRKLDAQRRNPLPAVSREECARRLKTALDRVYPLAARLGVAYPEVKLRLMKSQWGNCHWTKGYITLNTLLARCPEDLREYVALHELVHFLHHDHGPGFYQVMDALMPDWRQKRRELKGYTPGFDHL